MGIAKWRTKMHLNTPERIDFLRRAGNVKRFHTVQTVGGTPTVGAHSWGVAVLLDEIWQDCTKTLLQAALYHDVAEAILGDVPATAKWDYPTFANAIAEAEAEIEKEMGFTFMLTTEQKARLKMCDMLELVLYSFEQIKMGNHNFAVVFENGVKYLYKNFEHSSDFRHIKTILDSKLLRLDGIEFFRS